MLALYDLRFFKPQRLGYFRSYKSVGEYLAQHGETGQYGTVPSNARRLFAIKFINVTKYYDDEEEHYEREIEMEGSHY